MITTPTQSGLVVHYRYRIPETGGGIEKKHPQSTPISPMWPPIYSLSYLVVSECKPVLLWARFDRVEALIYPRRESSQYSCSTAVF
jgi:hypothetical protein